MADVMQQTRDEPSLGELFGELTRQMTALVRSEVQLATTEMSGKLSRLGRDVGFLVLGGAVAYAGFLALVAALVGLLALFVPWWLAALVVGLAIAGLGYWLVQRGLNALKQVDLAPRQTMETIKEDVEWAKEQTR